jgi:PIN domain nuclease of toxin-antitoxin system
VTAVVLDTHTALWWSFFPEKLSRPASAALRDAEELVLPSIIFWETALLVRKRRVELPVSPGAWLRGLSTTRRVKVAALSGAIAVRADQLRMHDDPADRFIVATAIARSAPLVTRDAAIRAVELVTTIW